MFVNVDTHHRVYVLARGQGMDREPPKKLVLTFYHSLRQGVCRLVPVYSKLPDFWEFPW